MKLLNVIILIFISSWCFSQESINDVCHKEMKNLLKTNTELKLAIERKDSLESEKGIYNFSIYDYLQWLVYKNRLIANGTCEITPEYMKMDSPPSSNRVTLDVLITKTIPADTTWNYTKPTFEGFMDWKIQEYVH